MKRFILTAVAAFSMQLAFAQNGAVTNATLFLKDGKLTEAKSAIDKAVVHEKTVGSAKAWFTKGEVYSAIVNSPLPAYRQLSSNALTESIEAYDKAISLDKPNGEFAKQATEKKTVLSEVVYISSFNEAVKFYQEQKFSDALNAFGKAATIKPQDTTAYLYAAASAEQAKNYSAAKDNYRKLITLKYNKPIVYNQLYIISKEVEKNDAEALKILEEGLKANPNNKELMLNELSMYISAGKGAEAVTKLENALKVDPNNTNLYIILGEVYDQTKKSDLAIANYEKALKLEPNNFNANYNMGVLHFNKGAEVNKKLQGLNAANYAKSAPKLEPEMKKHFNASLPYFETALKAQPNDLGTLDTIAKVYLALGRKKDADNMNAKADALMKKK